MDKVSLTDKLALIDEQWSPRIVGELNGQYVKLAKLQGEFLWHHHEAEDEMFLVLRGHLLIKLPDRQVSLDEGEFLIVPRGIDHCPIADEETHVLLFEPASTAHTGNVESDRTVSDHVWI